VQLVPYDPQTVAVSKTIPLHPGAIKYYRERGCRSRASAKTPRVGSRPHWNELIILAERRHPPRTLSMSDLAILRLLTTRKRPQNR
jgi:hypothetical protein